ncbi:MAG: ComEC/Rec2 family competence protein [Planctomycetota bacterium]|nr:ComEC/Rec2 family competence protein [Planctomycetota bacterium]
MVLSFLVASAPPPLGGEVGGEEFAPRAMVWDAAGRRTGLAPDLLGRAYLPDEDEPATPVARPRVAHEGELVLYLCGTPALPFARGPVPGSMQRAGVTGSAPLRVDRLVRLGPPPRSLVARLVAPVGRAVAAWRAGLLEASEALDAGLPPGLLEALLFGERDGLERQTTDLFTRTGTRHLLAISGLHVGLLAAFLILPLARLVARLSRRPQAELGATAALLLVFVPLAGASPPVIRAAVVLGLGLAGRRSGPFGRPVDGLNLWGAALCLEGLLAPERLTSLSLGLSYLATLGLLLGLGPLVRRLSGVCLAGLGRLPGLGLEPWRPAWSRPRRAVLVAALVRATSLAVASSLAAVLATLPVAWSVFGEVAPIGILLTPLVLPLLAWILTLAWPFTIALALFGGTTLERPLAAAGSLVLAPAADLLGGLLEVADGLPGSPIALPARPAVLVALAVLGSFLVLRSRLGIRTPGPARSRHLLAAATAFSWAILLMPWTVAPNHVEVVALDVGHGTGVALRLPSGQVWLFDGGTRDRLGLYRQAYAPLLARWDPGRPTVVLSHADLDHWSGLADLIERHPPRAWLGHLPGALAERLPNDCATLDLSAGRLELPLEGVTRLELLRGGPLAGNEGSRSLLVDGRLLLTGDAEAEGLARTLADGLGPVDLLLMPHHGSDTPLVDDLLDATRPREVWISGSGPPQLEAELLRRGLDLRQTRLEGPLELAGRGRRNRTLPPP